MTNDEYLKEALARIGLNIDKTKTGQFLTYLNLIKKWGKRVNITSILDEKDIILKHFTDSLTLNKHITPGSSVADIGTGGGFPGVPLMIYDPSIRMTLVESSNKKVSFLKELKRNLSLNDLIILCLRAENPDKELKNTFDFVLFRAVGETGYLLDIAKPYLKQGGRAVIMKSKTENLVDKPHSFVLDSSHEINLPFTGDFRKILIYSKTGV